MPNKSDDPTSSMHGELCNFEMVLTGAGAANMTIPTSPPARDNFATSGTRSALGVYALVYKEHFPRIIHVDAKTWASDGAAKHIQLVSVDEATKTINIKVWDLATPTAIDPAATDTVRVMVWARKNTH